MMKTRVFIMMVATILHFGVPAIAADKVVVVPLSKNDSNLLPENICSGITIQGVEGKRICLPPDTVVSAGYIWMDRNLGASRVATSSTDAAAYGDLYQWGRLADGHESRTSQTTLNRSDTDVPGHNSFILYPGAPYDWRNPQNDNLWQGDAGINNPCPPGFRLPTITEWETELRSWSSQDAAGAFASPLKLVLGGVRSATTGDVLYVDTQGCYWSSTVDGSSVSTLIIQTGDAGRNTGFRAAGWSVRCIMD